MGANPTINLNDFVPVAPSGKTNVKFQAAASVHGITVENVSAYIDSVTEGQIVLADVTTDNVTTSAHGFCPKLPGGTSTFFRADGAWAAPSGGGGSSNIGAAVVPGLALGDFTNNAGWNNYYVLVMMPAAWILNIPANTWKIVLLFTAGTGCHIDKCNIVRTARFSSTVVDRTVVKFGGNMPATVTYGGPPTAAAPAVQESDAISLALDQNHDYYIEFYFDTDGTYNGTVGFAQGNSSYAHQMASYDTTGDQTGSSSMPTVPTFGNGMLVGQVYVAS